jgi:hypothetical protein
MEPLSVSALPQDGLADTGFYIFALLLLQGSGNYVYHAYFDVQFLSVLPK